jgi:D-sedoheptulose 7-phosphate isomerase
MDAAGVGLMSEQVGDYIRRMQRALTRLRMEQIEAGFALLHDALEHGRGVYICGNGGSASTASHFAVDLGKNLRRRHGPRLRVVSLTDNIAWLTAIANDESYTDCFAEQLRHHLQPDDLLVGLSASGDSENVVRAFELARDVGANRLALVGFDGGRLARLASAIVWVDSHDYGIVESVHLFVVHQLVHRLIEHDDDKLAAPCLVATAGSPTARSCSIHDVPVAPISNDRLMQPIRPLP